MKLKLLGILLLVVALVASQTELFSLIWIYPSGDFEIKDIYTYDIDSDKKFETIVGLSKTYVKNVQIPDDPTTPEDESGFGEMKLCEGIVSVLDEEGEIIWTETPGDVFSPDDPFDPSPCAEDGCVTVIHSDDLCGTGGSLVFVGVTYCENTTSYVVVLDSNGKNVSTANGYLRLGPMSGSILKIITSDLNADNCKDLIVATTTTVHVFYTGCPACTLSKTPDWSYTPGGIIYDVEVVDLDDEDLPLKEIVIGADKVHVLEHNGSVKWIYEIDPNLPVKALYIYDLDSNLPADPDSDLEPEIIVGESWYIYVLDDLALPQNPLIQLNLVSGVSGTLVTVYGSGFGANEENIVLYFDTLPVAPTPVMLEPIPPTLSGTIAGSVKADGNGNFTATFSVPSSVGTVSVGPSTYIVDAGGALTSAASVPDIAFKIPASGPTLNLYPYSGDVSDVITVIGKNFFPGEDVTITYDDDPLNPPAPTALTLTPVFPTQSGSAPGTVKSDINGTFQARFQIPALPVGYYFIDASQASTPASSVPDEILKIPSDALFPIPPMPTKPNLKWKYETPPSEVRVIYAGNFISSRNVVVASHYSVYVLDSGGSLLLKFDNKQAVSGLKLKDLTKDGFNELIVSSNNYLSVYNTLGESIWNFDLVDNSVKTLAEDLNLDGFPEIVSGFSRSVYTFATGITGTLSAHEALSKGKLAFGLSKYQDALTYLLTALTKFKELGDTQKVQEVEALIAKAEKYLDAADVLKEADELFSQKKYEKAKSKYGEAKSLYLNLAEISKVSEIEGKITKCEGYLEANSHLKEARREYEARNFEKAKELAQQAHEEYDALGDNLKKEESNLIVINSNKQLQAKAYFDRALSYYSEGLYKNAINFYEKAEKVYEELGDIGMLEECQKGISLAEERLKPPPEEDFITKYREYLVYGGVAFGIFLMAVLILLIVVAKR
ncbi:MAG: hypothetical protein ACE5K0_02480 [Candidatus Methanofastidiosia archaeon]